MKHLLALYVGLLACCLSGSFLPAAWAADSPRRPVTLNEVVQSLEKREHATAMVELRWTDNVHYEAGSLLDPWFARSMQLKGKFLQHGVPAEPVTFHYPSELRLKGEQMEYISKTLSQDPAHDSVFLIPYTSSYDGRESKFFMGSRSPTVLNERRNTDVDTPHLLPILLYCRPLNATFGILHKKSLKLSDHVERINGHRCVRVDDGTTRVDLDCERGLIPVAFQRYVRNRRLFLEGVIEYSPHQTLSFVPRRFDAKRYDRASRVAETFSGDHFETHWGVPAK